VGNTQGESARCEQPLGDLQGFTPAPGKKRDLTPPKTPVCKKEDVQVVNRQKVPPMLGNIGQNTA